ncbi:MULTISPECIES: glycosyltransferase [Niastella]|uniref:Glycosyltransferase n=1 Tax=Niastella soli TaxID=2821487 RepID=A0ABS3YLS7_9BACT|nr:glycosyltransferase [Niastella soli]MBO9198833.1 glycosyltransferase [Niastella soli]
MYSKVCAILVTYNRLDTLKTAMEHVLAQTLLPATIVVVDNNSTDGTIEYLQSVHGENNIHSIFMENNTGSAGAIAAGMEFGLSNIEDQYDYFWVLDDDTFYAPNALQDLVENIENSEFSMIGLHGAHIRMGRKIQVKDDVRLQEVDYAMIDGALIKAEVVQHVGTICEEFFMMCDDHEYSVRMQRKGYKIGVLKNGADNRLYLGGGGQFTRATLWRGYYSARNHIFIIKKHFSFVNLFGYCLLQTKLLITAAFLAPDRFKRVRLRLTGILHGILGIGGRTLDPGTLKFTSQKAMKYVKSKKLVIHLPVITTHVLDVFDYLELSFNVI